MSTTDARPGNPAQRGAASQAVLRIAGASLLLGRRLEQAQRSGHLADGPVRVVGPEDAAVLRLGVAISDAVAERLAEGLAVAQPRRPGEDEIAEVDLVDEGLLRLGDLGGDEARPRLEEGRVVPERGRDDPVFVGGGVHPGAGELRGLRGEEHQLGALLRQASPALGILDVIADLHAHAAEVEIEDVVLGAGLHAAFQHDLPVRPGPDPARGGP